MFIDRGDGKDLTRFKIFMKIKINSSSYLCIFGSTHSCNDVVGVNSELGEFMENMPWERHFPLDDTRKNIHKQLAIATNTFS